MTAFAGFDTSSYPGDEVMKWLRDNTNFVWCGYYLGPAPSHPDASWMGKLDFLKGLNFGVAPLYVGQEVIGPGSHHTSGSQGVVDGKDAAALMKDEGFKEGSIVYLDLENGLPFPDSQKSYVRSWCNAVEDANYSAGVYCSHSFAAQVSQVVPAAMIWAFKVSTTDAHTVPGPHYPDPSPAGSGFAGAFIWQLGQHCLISVPPAPRGILTVDLDSASTPNPSIPGTNLTIDPAVADLWADAPTPQARFVMAVPTATAAQSASGAPSPRRGRRRP